MAGHYGVERVTIKALEVIPLDEERQPALRPGRVPAPPTLVIVKRSNKNDI